MYYGLHGGSTESSRRPSSPIGKATGVGGPVRIGNAAYNQLQLDIYGEMMVYAVHLYDWERHCPSARTCGAAWKRTILNWMIHHWREPDEGIWEARSGSTVAEHSIPSSCAGWRWTGACAWLERAQLCP